MKINIRTILVVVAIITVVVVFNTVRRNSTMRGIESSVTLNGTERLISEADVDSLITSQFPQIRKRDIKAIDCSDIEHMLSLCPYILSAKVSFSTGGKLIVKVTQRTPVVRMFFQNNEFYISEQGTVMPLAPKHYCNIIVGNSAWNEATVRGIKSLNLADTSDHDRPVSLTKIWTLARYLHDNPQHGDLFDQITLTADGDLVLSPKLGNFTVVVGDEHSLEQKFAKFDAFLDQGIGQVGWDTYKTISLKYKDQVVGTKSQR